jgi:hypothetical protein
MWSCTAGRTEVRIGANRAFVTYSDTFAGEFFARQAVMTIDDEIVVAHASRDCTALKNADELQGKIAVFDATLCLANITGFLVEQLNARAVIIVFPSTGKSVSESVGSSWTADLEDEWNERLYEWDDMLCSAPRLSTGTNIPVLISSSTGDAATVWAGVGAQAGLTIGRCPSRPRALCSFFRPFGALLLAAHH